MAESTISGLVLDRRAKSFVDSETKENVEYFDVLIFNPEADPSLTVFRTQDRAELEQFQDGTHVKDVPCRVEKRHTVPISLVKSPRASNAGIRI